MSPSICMVTSPQMTADLLDQVRAIHDWRHPYEINGQPLSLARSWYAEWHAWRWAVDVPILSEALGSFVGKTVLDVACNDGWYGFQAEQKGAIVTGIDGREDAINRANLLRRVMDRKHLVSARGHRTARTARRSVRRHAILWDPVSFGRPNPRAQPHGTSDLAHHSCPDLHSCVGYSAAPPPAPRKHRKARIGSAILDNSPDLKRDRNDAEGGRIRACLSCEACRQPSTQS